MSSHFPNFSSSLHIQTLYTLYSTVFGFGTESSVDRHHLDSGRAISISGRAIQFRVGPEIDEFKNFPGNFLKVLRHVPDPTTVDYKV